VLIPLHKEGWAMSNRQTSLTGWSLLAGWTFAGAIGWAAGLAVGVLLTLAATKLAWLNQDHFFVCVTLISLGLSIGAAQPVVMRRYLPIGGERRCSNANTAI
jgi:hypothetical protein